MATRSAVTNITLKIDCTISNTLDSGKTASAPVGIELLKLKLTDGVSASQANRGWSVVDRSLASGASETISLYDLDTIDAGAGTGRDALGQTLTFEEIVSLAIKQTGGSGRLEINPSGAPAEGITWIGSQTVANGGALRSGGVRMYHESDESALDITDGVSHKITLKAVNGAVTYSVVVVGRHDDDESSSSSLSSSSSSASSLSTTTQTSLSTTSVSTSSSSTSSISSQSSSSSSSRSTSSSVNSSSSSTSSVNSSSSSTSTTSVSSSSSSSNSSTSS